MRFHHLLQTAGLPTLLFVGFGAGAAVAHFRVDEIPEAIATAPHCVAANLPAQALSPEAIKAYEDAEPPLWNDLGSLTYPVSTKSSEAQSYFDQGLRLAANFNHAEARRAFRKAQRLDPTCAMCFLRRGAGARTEHQRADGPRSECAGRGCASEGAGACRRRERKGTAD